MATVMQVLLAVVEMAVEGMVLSSHRLCVPHVFRLNSICSIDKNSMILKKQQMGNK